MWKTLRFRLAVWNAVVVVTTAVVTLVGLRQGVRWAILHEMDQILTEDIQEISLALHDAPAHAWDDLTDELTRKSIGHRQHGWFVDLLDKEQAVLWCSTAAGPLIQPTRSTRSEPFTIGDYRLVQRPVADHSNRVAFVRVGATLALLDEDMARIDRLVLLAVGFVLVAAPLLGFWLASRAAQVIGEITRTAEQLRPSELDERLPIRGTGDELDRLAHTVNGLLDRIADYLEKKRDFLANAAHELRTPLAAIRSSVEVALSSERSREEYQELLVEIIDQGESLETLVNQLLLISESEVERLKVDHDAVPFDELVRRSADMFAGVAEAQEIDLVVQAADTVSIRGNRHLLRQVVNNLIDNAIKYTPAGGRVTVQLLRDVPSQTAQLSVVDTGIGISESDLPRVFDRFFRADKSRTRMSETAGTGLGLSICKAAVAAHGGTIECRSQMHAGTTFVVRLPFDPARTTQTRISVRADIDQDLIQR